jgi:glycine hydroxymethyltransferase
MGKDFENTWGKIAPKSGRIKMVSELIDSAVMPGMQGGPLMHVIAGKAVAFAEALRPEYKLYCRQVVDNAKALADSLLELGYDLVSGGTDTHVILIDLTKMGVTGKKAENTLERAGITTNKNMVPFDERSPMITSGIRVGTPAMTTRGMGVEEMKNITTLIHEVIQNIDDENTILKVREEVALLCGSFPLYEEVTA